MNNAHKFKITMLQVLRENNQTRLPASINNWVDLLIAEGTSIEGPVVIEACKRLGVPRTKRCISTFLTAN